MSINGPSAITAKASKERPDGRFLGLLHAVALTAVVAGAGGSVGLMLWVGHRNPQPILVVLFAIWVLAPFVALLLVSMVSKRWSVLTRATLYSVMLVLTLSSLAIYGYVVIHPPEKPAFAFLVVPLGSWLLMTLIIPIAAFISGRLSHRDAGA